MDDSAQCPWAHKPWRCSNGNLLIASYLAELLHPECMFSHWTMTRIANSFFFFPQEFERTAVVDSSPMGNKVQYLWRMSLFLKRQPKLILFLVLFVILPGQTSLSMWCMGKCTGLKAMRHPRKQLRVCEYPTRFQSLGWELTDSALV